MQRPTYHLFRLATPILAASLCLAVTLRTDQPARGKDSEKPTKAIDKGLRVFTAGHSFHFYIPLVMSDMVRSARIKDHAHDLQHLGGSRVITHWELPDEKDKLRKTLRTGKVDVLTLSPIYLPDEGIDHFTRLALEHNPNIRITIQANWLFYDDGEPGKKPPVKVDRNSKTGEQLWKEQSRYFKSIDDQVTALNKQHGKQVLYVVPVGQAVIGLREKIIAGQAPGLKTQEELFSDGVGHSNREIQVLNAYCHFAVIYRRSPVGLPLPEHAKQAKWDEKLNRLLQELAWEAVVKHPLSGVKVAPKP